MTSRAESGPQISRDHQHPNPLHAGRKFSCSRDRDERQNYVNKLKLNRELNRFFLGGEESSQLLKSERVRALQCFTNIELDLSLNIFLLTGHDKTSHDVTHHYDQEILARITER